MIENVDPAHLTSERVWRELEAKLRPFVARRVREVDVDDVVQEVFLRIQRGVSSLRDEERFGPWIYQVARNVIIDHLRSSARHPQPPTSLYPTDRADEADDRTRPDVPGLRGWGDPTDHSDEADDRAVEREVASYVALFVTMLPSPYREALTLTELEGLTQKEAAEMLGISLSGMKSRVQRGRLKLRAALEDCCHIALDARRRVVGCEPRTDGKLPDGCCT